MIKVLLTSLLISPAPLGAQPFKISNPPGASAASVTGKVDKAGDTMTGTLNFDPGTAGSPSFTFGDGQNSGMFSLGGGTWAWVVNGIQIASVTADIFHFFKEIQVSTLNLNGSAILVNGQPFFDSQTNLLTVGTLIADTVTDTSGVSVEDLNASTQSNRTAIDNNEANLFQVAIDTTAIETSKVNRAGDTMTGDLAGTGFFASTFTARFGEGVDSSTVTVASSESPEDFPVGGGGAGFYANGKEPRFSGVGYGTGNGVVMNLAFAQGTNQAPAAVANNNTLGTIRWHAFDGTAWNVNSAIDIRGRTSESWAPGSEGTRLEIRTTPIGTDSKLTALVVEADGGLTVTGRMASDSVTVTSNTTIGGSLTVTSNIIAGSVTADLSGSTRTIRRVSTAPVAGQPVDSLVFVGVATMTFSESAVGRDVFGRASVTIVNASGAGKDYSVRVTRDGVVISGVITASIGGGDSQTLSPGWIEIGDSSAAEYILQVMTSNITGTQTADAQFMLALEF